MKMSCLRVNDVFDELNYENERLKQCLKVFIKFKTFIDFISDKIEVNLNANESQKLKQLKRDFEVIVNKYVEDFTRKPDSNYDNKDVNKNIKTETNSKNKTIFLKTDSENDEQNGSLIIDRRRIKPLNPRNEKRVLVKNHIKEINKNIKNKSKSKKTTKKSSKQMNRNKSNPKPMNETIVCDFIGCGKEFTSRPELIIHSKTHMSSGIKTFVCDFVGCGYKTTRGWIFKDHLNIHSGVRPHKCDSCGKAFAAKTCLTIHRKKKHTSDPMVWEKIYKCRVKGCKRMFDTKIGLITHKKVHLRVKPFKCEHKNCDFSTDRQYLLENHIHFKHLKDRHFKCHIEGCDKDYNSPSLLNEHMKAHNPNFRFKCSYEGCHKDYSKNSALKTHIIVCHSNIRFSCEWPGCEYRSGRKETLRKHQDSHISERNFVCDWPECGKRFKNSRQLSLHLRIHKNDKPYACLWPGCQYRCTDSGNFVKHRKIHEKNFKLQE